MDRGNSGAHQKTMPINMERDQGARRIDVTQCININFHRHVYNVCFVSNVWSRNKMTEF